MFELNQNARQGINNALQSNFRVTALLTDQNGLIAQITPALQTLPPADQMRLHKNLLTLVCQTSQTSRALAALLTPKGSKETDVKPTINQALEAIALAKALGLTLPPAPKKPSNAAMSVWD